MAIETKILCDGCGKIRGEANRWWIVSVVCGHRDFICQPFHNTTLNDWREDDLHLCGEACAVKKFSEFLRTAQ